MELEYYRNFISVIENGNITTAAEKLHIAQSALSAQIRTLENYFNTKLIITRRGIRNFEVTDAGNMLYKKAIYLCYLEDMSKEEIKAIAHGSKGVLRISLSPSSSISFINKYLVDFHNAYPNVTYELYEVPIRTQTHQLLSGITEFGVANAPLEKPESFETIYAAKEYLVAISHKDSSFLQGYGGSIKLHDLQNVPVSLSRGCSTLFKEICAKEKFTPNILSINTTKTSTITWAKRKCSVAIIPYNLTDELAPTLNCRVFDDPRLTVDNSLLKVTDKTLSPIARHFLSFIKKKISELNTLYINQPFQPLVPNPQWLNSVVPRPQN